MAEQQVFGFGAADETGRECSHHWVIQDGDGPTSAGICRLCGARKQFKNYVVTSHWGEERPRSESHANLLGRPSRSRAILEDDEDG